MLSVAVVGASGFTGAELMRICASHPELEVVLATGDTQAGARVADLYPSLAPKYSDMQYVAYGPGAAAGVDLAFLALPHGASQTVAAQLMDDVRWVVDLGADFRLDVETYERWYGEPHGAGGLIGSAAYGLPELFRSQIPGSSLVAGPGCYPTASALALAPFVESGVIEPTGIVVDAASGVSGAGRPPKAHTTFCAADEDFTAYGLLDHRHTPEIEQSLSRVSSHGAASVLFTPHLAPMSRGILATCYARPREATSTGELLEVLRQRFVDEPFVHVTDGSPSTKATLGSNSAHVTARYDERTGWVMAICAIDNLVKGASGQAVQCANILAGLDETTGLSALGVYP